MTAARDRRGNSGLRAGIGDPLQLAQQVACTLPPIVRGLGEALSNQAVERRRGHRLHGGNRRRIGGHQRRDQAGLAGWPRTSAKVIRSDTQEQHDVDKKTGDVSVIYSADTVFQYEVGGKQYSTNLIHFGQTLGSGDASEAELQYLR